MAFDADDLTTGAVLHRFGAKGSGDATLVQCCLDALTMFDERSDLEIFGGDNISFMQGSFGEVVVVKITAVDGCEADIFEVCLAQIDHRAIKRCVGGDLLVGLVE